MVVLAMASAAAAQTAPASPPIFQPGAPGAQTRTLTAGQSVELSRTTHTQADADFMRHMIVHHGQAVEMVRLLKLHGRDATVQKLGERISMSQDAEMALMRRWLTERGLTTEMPMDHSAMSGMDHAAMGHAPSDQALMPGMLSPAQMATLAAARGIAFDRLFLEGMIQHHRGALSMVEDLLESPNAAQDPLLSDFATSVVADQSAEIGRMQMLLANLPQS